MSANIPDGYIQARQRSGSSPLRPPLAKPPGYPAQSKPTSPAGVSYSGFSSPKLSEYFSPVSASPRSGSAAKEASNDFHTPSTIPSHESRGSHGEMAPASIPPFMSHPSTSSTASSSTGNFPLYQSYKDLPQRRPRRESSDVPALTHEETTLSSNSAVLPVPYQGSLLPALDASKSQRMLPQPIPMPGVIPSPLDARPTHLPNPNQTPSQQSPDYRQPSSLAVLLRAGELARDAELNPDERDRHG